MYAYQGCGSYSFHLLSFLIYLPEKNDFLQNNYYGECDQNILYTSMKPIIYTTGPILLYKKNPLINMSGICRPWQGIL